MKHTKGKWLVGNLVMNDGAIAITCDKGDGENKAHIAYVSPHSEFKRGQGWQLQCAERDANARLIAAAPELLHALEQFMGGARSMGWDTTQAEAAIAKAKG